MTTQIKMIVLDVDGVMTDGKKYYDRKGAVVVKSFCDKDWTAIKRFRAIGINVVCITGDGFNAAILANRNIPVIICRTDNAHTDKSNYLAGIIEEYDCTYDEVCVVGDDLFDLKLMMMVKHRFCLLDSPSVVKQYCDVLGCKGGENAIAVLFDRLEGFELIPKVPWQEAMDKIYEIDAKERF